MTPTTPAEDVLRDLFTRATADLRAPAPQASSARPSDIRAGRRRVPFALMAGAAAAAAAALVVAVVPTSHPTPQRTHTAAPAGGQPVLLQLAAAVRSAPAPTGRYAVQIERQTEGSVSYTKASVVDSQTGDTWTYQQGAGVPPVLPMAPHLLPTEAQLSAMPTDPAALRSALLTEASGSTARSADAAVFDQAVQTLWNPLLGSNLRAALLTVISSTPGVQVDAHARDAQGRASIETSYSDPATGKTTSEWLDPTTGTVNELALDSSGTDVFLSLTRTDGPPTVDPLTGAAAGTPTPGVTTAPGVTAAPPVTAPPAAGGSSAPPQSVFFGSPSGNISCQLSDGGSAATTFAYCQTGNPMQSATLAADGTYTQCHGASCMSNPPATATTLAYGQSQALGPFTCTSASSGITCTSGGQGFAISQSGITPVTETKSVFFGAASGNISCQLSDGATKADTFANCQTGNPMQSATLAADGTYTQCHGASCMSNPPATATTLAYGQSQALGPFTCTSASSGITCTAAGRGFVISQSGISSAG